MLAKTSEPKHGPPRAGRPRKRRPARRAVALYLPDPEPGPFPGPVRRQLRTPAALILSRAQAQHLLIVLEIDCLILLSNSARNWVTLSLLFKGQGLHQGALRLIKPWHLCKFYLGCTDQVRVTPSLNSE